MPSVDPGAAERVLLLAPPPPLSGEGDAPPFADAILREAGLGIVVCADPEDLVRELGAGAGTLVLDARQLDALGSAGLGSLLGGQPTWSDLPTILFCNRDAPATLGAPWAGKCTVLERPVSPRTLVSVARTALAARRRQYQVREHVLALRANEDALRGTEARLRLFIEHAPAAIAMFDARMYYIAASRRWVTDYRLEGTQVIGRSHYDVFPEIPERWREIHRRALRGEAIRCDEDRFDRMNGDVAWLKWEIIPWLEPDGRVGGIVIFTEDITSHKKSEAALDESRRLVQERATELDTVLRAAPAAIWIAHDPECRVITGNPASYRLLESENGINVSATAQPGRTRSFREYRDGAPVPVGELPMQKAARTGRPIEGTELSFVFDDGRVRHAYGNASPLLTPEGQVGGAVAAFVDVTPLKEAERALREADRRKDNFLAILAHELRNPLAPIRTAIELLRLTGSPSPRFEWARDVIDRQVRQMARLIDDLLDLGRIGRDALELRRERVDLATVVLGAVEAARPLIEERGHRLEVQLPQDLVPLDADPTRMTQVVLNLLNNAAKFTDPGGRIVLSATKDGGEARIAVEDNGIGFDPARLPQLFDMFSQAENALSRAQGGLGIGLYLVRRLVELHGGSVGARSAGPGLGSVFTVRVPVAGQAPVSEPARVDAHTAPNARRRILVVDDNLDAADSLASLLTVVGHEVREAHDGEQALKVADDFRPQVVLLDIGLPKMNGYDVARRLRERDWARGALLVAVTGWGQEGDRARAADAGFDRHLVKPVDPDALLSLVAR